MSLEPLFSRERALLAEADRYRRFAGAVFLFDLAYWTHVMAVPVLAYQLTGRAEVVARVMACHGLVALASLLGSRPLFARVAREKVARAACAALAAAAAVAALFVPLTDVARLFPFVAMFALLNQLHSPASYSMVPRLAGGPDRQKTLNSIRSGAFIVASLAGPLLASGLIEAGWLARYPFVIAALAATAAWLYGAVERAAAVSPALESAAGGRVPAKVWLYVSFWFLMCLSFGFDAMMVVFVREHLGLAEVWVGLLLAVCGLASVAGSALVNTFEGSETLPNLAGYFALTGASLAVFAALRSPPAAFAAVAVVGLGYGLAYNAFHVNLQRAVPDAALPEAYLRVQAAQVLGLLLSVLGSKALLPRLGIDGVYGAYAAAILAGAACILLSARILVIRPTGVALRAGEATAP